MDNLFYIVSFLLGALGAWAVMRFGASFGLLDYPNDRSSHTDPRPKGGGLGILLAFVLAVFWWKIPIALSVPAASVSVVSLWGDIRELSVRIRLGAHFVSGLLVGGFIFIIEPSIHTALGVSVLLTLLGAIFISATANFYNFMDGIDGLAGVTGTIAFALLGTYGFIEGKAVSASSVALGIAAACLGFLPFNLPRARVFMGDVGSILIGFLFATWVIRNAGSVTEFAVMASFLLPFFVDEFNTQWARIRSKERLDNPHRRHIYQVLVHQAGFSHIATTAGYGIFQILAALTSWMLMKISVLAVLSWLIGLSMVSMYGASFVRRRWESQVGD